MGGNWFIRYVRSFFRYFIQVPPEYITVFAVNRIVSNENAFPSTRRREVSRAAHVSRVEFRLSFRREPRRPIERSTIAPWKAAEKSGLRSGKYYPSLLTNSMEQPGMENPSRSLADVVDRHHEMGSTGIGTFENYHHLKRFLRFSTYLETRENFQRIPSFESK